METVNIGDMGWGWTRLKVTKFETRFQKGRKEIEILSSLREGAMKNNYLLQNIYLMFFVISSIIGYSLNSMNSFAKTLQRFVIDW